MFERLLFSEIYVLRTRKDVFKADLSLCELKSMRSIIVPLSNGLMMMSIQHTRREKEEGDMAPLIPSWIEKIDGRVIGKAQAIPDRFEISPYNMHERLSSLTVNAIMVDK